MPVDGDDMTWTADASASVMSVTDLVRALRRMQKQIDALTERVAALEARQGGPTVEEYRRQAADKTGGE